MDRSIDGSKTEKMKKEERCPIVVIKTARSATPQRSRRRQRVCSSSRRVTSYGRGHESCARESSPPYHVDRPIDRSSISGINHVHAHANDLIRCTTHHPHSLQHTQQKRASTEASDAASAGSPTAPAGAPQHPQRQAARNDAGLVRQGTCVVSPCLHRSTP